MKKTILTREVVSYRIICKATDSKPALDWLTKKVLYGEYHYADFCFDNTNPSDHPDKFTIDADLFIRNLIECCGDDSQSATRLSNFIFWHPKPMVHAEKAILSNRPFLWSSLVKKAIDRHLISEDFLLGGIENFHRRFWFSSSIQTALLKQLINRYIDDGGKLIQKSFLIETQHVKNYQPELLFEIEKNVISSWPFVQDSSNIGSSDLYNFIQSGIALQREEEVIELLADVATTAMPQQLKSISGKFFELLKSIINLNNEDLTRRVLEEIAKAAVVNEQLTVLQVELITMTAYNKYPHFRDLISRVMLNLCKSAKKFGPDEALLVIKHCRPDIAFALFQGKNDPQTGDPLALEASYQINHNHPFSQAAQQMSKLIDILELTDDAQAYRLKKICAQEFSILFAQDRIVC